jgi:hypothetical protein
MRRAASSLVGAVALAWLAPGAARAEGVARSAPTAEERARVEVGGVVTLEPTSPDVTTAHVAPWLSAGLTLAKPVALTLDATYAVTTYRLAHRARSTVGRWGNPLVAVHLLAPEGPPEAAGSTWSGRIGVGTAPPLVTVPGTIHANAAADLADRVALGARGFEGPWLWADNAIPIVVLAAAAWRVNERVELTADLQPGHLLSVNRRASRVALDATAAVRFHVGGSIPELLIHSFVQSEPIEDGDFAQTSAAVAITKEAGRWWVRSGVIVGLDGPAGFGERNATGMGLSAAVGAGF